MAASMSFRPGGAEGDDDFDDGFCFGDAEDVKAKPFDPIGMTTSSENAYPGRGGFGAPKAKPKPASPIKHYKRASDKPHTVIDVKALHTNEDFKMAIVRGHQQVVLQCLRDGFAVDSVLRSGWTGLMYAANNANSDLVTILLDNGANPNYNKDMYTVLMTACGASGYPEKDVLQCVDLLLGKGAQVNCYDRYHLSPLMYASREGRPEVIQRLVEEGANINKQDSRGWTGLTWAFSKNRRAAVKALVDLKADANLKHCDGQTVVEMAGALEDSHMLEILTGKKRVNSDHPVASQQTAVIGSHNSSNNATGISGSMGSYGTTYGELELFLCGLDLSQFVDMFQAQHVDFNTFLRMTEDDLIKMGIQQIGVRKKILDGIETVHKKEWEPSSLTQLKYQKHISCAEAIAVVANISKHTKYITTTLGFLQDQVQRHPKILEELQDGTGPRQLHQHTQDTMKNVTALGTQLDSLRLSLDKILSVGTYTPPDLIDKSKCESQSHKLRNSVLVILSGSALAVILWNKRQYVLDNVLRYVKSS